MAHERGNHFLVYVGSGNPFTYHLIGGQRDGSIAMENSPIDVTDKQNDFMQYIDGDRGLVVEVSGVADWPDTNGIELVRESAETDRKLPLRIVLNNEGDALIGIFLVQSHEIGATNSEGTAYSITFISDGFPVLEGYLLQENGFKILQEDGAALLL